MYTIERFIPVFTVFTAVTVVPPPVCAQSGTSDYTTENETTFLVDEPSCISNYAEMKQALFQNGVGNIERLLYTFTPTNTPIPHYVWVFFYHNESTEWRDVLECPSSNSLDKCPTPENVTAENEAHHILFWSDSPLLVNMDIPLFKFLTYNHILGFLRGACVQLVIPPFCDSVDSQSVIDILKFATSFVSCMQKHYTCT